MKNVKEHIQHKDTEYHIQYKLSHNSTTRLEKLENVTDECNLLAMIA